MREMFHLSMWRTPHWLIFIAGVMALGMYSGVLPAPAQIGSWFESRADVSQSFRDPNMGRADALLLVFGTLFLAPLALFIALVALIFLIAMLGGFMLPLTRWFSLPDWSATAFVVSAVGVMAWMHSDLWMPQSLWFLGLLARACRVVLA